MPQRQNQITMPSVQLSEVSHLGVMLQALLTVQKSPITTRHSHSPYFPYLPDHHYPSYAHSSPSRWISTPSLHLSTVIRPTRWRSTD